jgi:hypothetical protein
MALTLSASGVRVDCDACGAHESGSYARVGSLRYATGFVRRHGLDYCPRCALLDAALLAAFCDIEFADDDDWPE